MHDEEEPDTMDYEKGPRYALASVAWESFIESVKGKFFAESLDRETEDDGKIKEWVQDEISFEAYIWTVLFYHLQGQAMATWSKGGVSKTFDTFVHLVTAERKCWSNITATESPGLDVLQEESAFSSMIYSRNIDVITKKQRLKRKSGASMSSEASKQESSYNESPAKIQRTNDFDNTYISDQPFTSLFPNPSQFQFDNQVSQSSNFSNPSQSQLFK